MKKMSYPLGVLASVFLVACGGGGGSSTPAAPAAAVSVPLLATIQKDVNSSRSYNFNVSGYYSTSGNTITGAVSRTVSAGVPSVVGGTTYTYVTGTTTGTATAKDGTALDLNSTGIEYLNPTTYATVIADDSNSYAVYSSYTYPATLTVGDAGQYATAVLYSSSAKTTVIGSATVSYEALANTSDSLKVRQTTNIYNTSSQLTYQTIATSTINTAGTSSLDSVELYDFGIIPSSPKYYIKYGK